MNDPLTISAHLTRSHGNTSNDLTIAIWSRFSAAVLEAIARAGTQLMNAETIRPYQARDGWWRTARQKNASGVLVAIPSEDAITDALVDTLEGLRAAAPPGDPLYELNIAFASQQPRQVQTRAGARSLTTDLRAFVPGNPKLDFRVEAKVLFKGRDLTAGYLGTEGLMRFADPANPYTTGMVGGMLAYAVAPQKPDWGMRIADALIGHSSAANVGKVAFASSAAPLSACDLVSADDNRVVTVLHIVLPFNTDPAC